MSLPRYPRYKDSGLDAFGSVPEHWNMTRLRFVATLNPSKSEVANLDKETEVSFLPMDSIGDDGSINLEQVRPISQVETGYTFFRDGDVTLAKITPCFENGKGAIMRGLLGGVGFGTTELVVARPVVGQTISEYLHWFFVSSNFRKPGEGAMYGAGGQKRISDDFVRNFPVSFPPLEEQFAIATFLDRETAKIDALISEQEKLITLLTEKRQATISHAVTKGLNPNMPMKASGVRWMGEVRGDWKVGNIQSFARRESGHTPSRQHPEYWENCTIPWFTLADVWRIRSGSVKYIHETKELVSELGLKNSSARLLPAGTVVLSRTASVGYSAIMGVDMATTQDFVNWVCNAELNPEFLLYVLRCMRPEFDRLMMGSTHQTIYMPDIAKLRMALPSIEEQSEIIAFLDEKTAALDALSEAAIRGISLLKERRSALISAAVTGKIDVRDVVQQEQLTTQKAA
ncbi:restriction endonuclease subunit S [Duganella sp. LX20W]|uniref:Restriction endonuclease subunit S n=1 Tax=Rugamonas brunnea TaxID=2758569 RepID=A0A7W2EX62_9BURK|nr:restriction endonuclease subunit S [Rugamonas brunnea]MBA5640252.1 restriction endonuclease subunit S [Rugamonas brunnea]